MNKKLKISDDSGFIGLANLNKYNGFIGRHWDFDLIKKRVIEEMCKNKILFWSTGREDTWNVLITMNSENLHSNPYREEEALIEVTHNKLHFVNYETLTMAAQFKDIVLPESHMKDLSINLENGHYLVSISQLLNPELYDERSEIDFEIRLEKIINIEDYYPNDFNNIFWNQYK